MTTTDRRLLEQVDIKARDRARMGRNLAALQESGQLTARSAGPMIKGTREALEWQAEFLAKTQTETPGESRQLGEGRVRQGIARGLAKRGERYDPAVYEKALAMLDYLFAPMTTKEQWDDYRKWALNPNASYAEMPPGSFTPELVVGAFNIPGSIQALRDIWRDVKNGEVGMFTALDALGAIPIAGALVGMAARADDIGDAAKRFARLSEMDDLVEDAARPGQAMPESLRLLKLAEEDPKAFAEMNAYRAANGDQPISIERLNFIEQNRIERELPYEDVALGQQYVERRKAKEAVDVERRQRLADDVDAEYERMEREGMQAEAMFDPDVPGAWDRFGSYPQPEGTVRLYRRTKEPAVLDPSSPSSRNNMEGAEKTRRENYGETFPDRTNWYSEGREAVEPEFRNFGHEVAVDIPRDRLYDIEADAQGWVAEAGPGGNFTDFERRIADNPDYDGIILPSQNRVDLFTDAEDKVVARIDLKSGDEIPPPPGSMESHQRNVRAIWDQYDDQPSWVAAKYAEDYAEEHGIPIEWLDQPHSDYLRDRYNMPDVGEAKRIDENLAQSTREIVTGELGAVGDERFHVMSLREDGRTIGQLKYSLVGDEALASWVGVAEDRRRTGAASELWDQFGQDMENLGVSKVFTNDQTDEGRAFLRSINADVEELGTLPSVRVGLFDSPEPSLAAHRAEQAKPRLRIRSSATGRQVVENHNSPVGGAGGSSTRYSDGQNMGALEEGYVGALGEKQAVSGVIAKEDFTPEAVDAFIAENADFLGGEEGLAVGTWENPETGMIELDVSKVFEDREKALKYAARNGHEAVWDLANEADLNVREQTGLENLMRPEERLLYLDDDGFPQGKLVEMWGQAPSARELASAAGAGAAARGWYRASSAALVDVFGEDAPRFAAILAAMSPQTSVEENLKSALLFWGDWTAKGRPTDRATIDGIMRQIVPPPDVPPGGFTHGVFVPESAGNNVWRAAISPDPVVDYISGAKVDSFMGNLLQDVDRVTMDTWGSKYLGMNPTQLNSRQATLTALQSPEYRAYRETKAHELRLPEGARATPSKKTPDKPGKLLRQGQYDTAGGIGVASRGYALGGAVHREAADLMTDLTGVKWTPEEIQETAWSFFKSVIDKDPTRPENWIRLMDETTPEEIAKAASFDQLLQDEGYRGLVESFGGDLPQHRPELRGAEVPEGVVRQPDLESLMGRAQRHKAGEFDIPSLLLPFGGGSLLGAHFLRKKEEEKGGGLL